MSLTETSDQAKPRASRVGTRARTRTLVWLLTGLQALAFIVIAVIYPAWQEPDEPAHVDMVLAYRTGDWLAGPGERQPQSGVIKSYASVPNFKTKRWGDVQPLDFESRLSFDEYGVGPAKGQPNQMVQHPPAYYIASAGYTYLIPYFDDLRFDVQVFALRAFSMLLMSPIPWLVVRTATRLTGRPHLGVVAMLMVMLVPTYLRTGASVSNDSLMMLAGFGLLALLARVLAGDNSMRTAVFVGVVFTLGMLTKASMLVMPPIVVLAYIFGRKKWATTWRPLLVAAAIPAVFGGWWWIRNLLVYGTIQPSGYGAIWGPDKRYGGDRVGASLSEFSEVFTRMTFRRFWGTFGMLDAPRMAVWTTWALSIISVVLVLVGMFIGFRRLPRRLAGSITLVLPAVFGILFMAAICYSVYKDKRVYPGIQARYFLPFVGGAAIAAAVAVSRIFGYHWVVVAALGIWSVWTFIWTQHFIIQKAAPSTPRLWDRLIGGWRYVSGWAPWPRPVTGLLIVALGVVMVLMIVNALRTARMKVKRRGGDLALSPHGEE